MLFLDVNTFSPSEDPPKAMWIRQSDQPLPEKVMALPIYIGSPSDRNSIVDKLPWGPRALPNSNYLSMFGWN